jgi:hypothetical protein
MGFSEACVGLFWFVNVLGVLFGQYGIPRYEFYVLFLWFPPFILHNSFCEGWVI